MMIRIHDYSRNCWKFQCREEVEVYFIEPNSQTLIFHASCKNHKDDPPFYRDAVDSKKDQISKCAINQMMLAAKNFESRLQEIRKADRKYLE